MFRKLRRTSNWAGQLFIWACLGKWMMWAFTTHPGMNWYTVLAVVGSFFVVWSLEQGERDQISNLDREERERFKF